MLSPAAHLTAFDVSCLWLGLDDVRIHAVSGEAALKAVLIAHGVVLETIWGIEHDPADFGANELVATWSAVFKGQEWANGDWNPETITVYSVAKEAADCCAPC